MKRLTGIGMLVLAIAGATMAFSLPADARGCSSGWSNNRGWGSNRSWGRQQRFNSYRQFSRNYNQRFGAYNLQGRYSNWNPGQNTAAWYYR